MPQSTHISIDPAVLANALAIHQTVLLAGCFFLEHKTTLPIELHDATLLPPQSEQNQPKPATTLRLQLTAAPYGYQTEPQLITPLRHSGTAKLNVPQGHPVLKLLPHLQLSETEAIPLYYSHTLSLAQTHRLFQNHITTKKLPPSLLSLWNIPFQITTYQHWPSTRHLDPVLEVALRYPASSDLMIGDTFSLHLQELNQLYETPSNQFAIVRDHLLLRYIFPLLDHNWTVLTSFSAFDDEEAPRIYTELPLPQPHLQNNVPLCSEASNEYTLRYNANAINKALPDDPHSHTQLLLDFFSETSTFPSLPQLKQRLLTIEAQTRIAELLC